MPSQLTIVRRGQIYVHPRSDPYARNADRNFNHAPSIVVMPDNRLLTMWFSAPWEGHHWQALLASSSADGGDTWSSARVFQDTHGSPDFDPAFIRDGDRVWLFFAYAPHYAKLAGQKTGRLGCWVRYTDDSSRTWSDAVQLCEPEGPRTNGIVLRNGDLLIGVGARETAACVLKSSDRGRTWNKRGRIVGPHGHDEPTIVELADGSVLMYLRNKSGHIWRSWSADGGETWSAAEPTDVAANQSSYCLYRMRDGRIALAYNPCAPHLRSPLVLCTSDDEGSTWSEPVVLDEISLPEGTPGHCAVTYPSLAQSAEGDLIAVWARYWITDVEHCGDICFAQVCPLQERTYD
jgi:predicted neuraminidase